MSKSMKKSNRVIEQNVGLAKTLIGELIGVSAKTVSRMLKDGRLKGQMLSDVIEYVKSNLV